ncbi:hypothetical protein L1987_01257 [Smallanthus sonchifolius]|uniref:Uncharacterized protein n=1 Tax=Smallanthus sonchifolius TaxID=185202 RepID=A0ACB9K4P0_9ASTR|nr:hypothetical protein L1987_01257 [Smallanthus sonchifolius]
MKHHRAPALRSLVNKAPAVHPPRSFSLLDLFGFSPSPIDLDLHPPKSILILIFPTQITDVGLHIRDGDGELGFHHRCRREREQRGDFGVF